MIACNTGWRLQRAQATATRRTARAVGDDGPRRYAQTGTLLGQNNKRRTSVAMTAWGGLAPNATSIEVSRGSSALSLAVLWEKLAVACQGHSCADIMPGT